MSVLLKQDVVMGVRTALAVFIVSAILDTTLPVMESAVEVVFVCALMESF